MATKAFEPAHFDTFVVQTVRVNDHSYGHRSLSLLFTPDVVCNIQAVRFNMRPGGEPGHPDDGVLSLETLPFDRSIDTKYVYDYPVLAPFITINVEDVKKMLQSRKRHLFQYVKGEGSSHWCWRVVRDMTHMGWLAESAEQELWNRLGDSVQHGKFVV